MGAFSCANRRSTASRGLVRRSPEARSVATTSAPLARAALAFPLIGAERSSGGRILQLHCSCVIAKEAGFPLWRAGGPRIARVLDQAIELQADVRRLGRRVGERDRP